MKKKIYTAMILLAALSILLVSGICIFYFNGMIRRQSEEELHEETAYMARAYESAGEGASFCEAAGSLTDTRITLIAPDGTVLYDSEADAAGMENHLERPEVREALEKGHGKNSRLSATMRFVTFYDAVLLSDGNVLRLSSEHESDYQIFLRILPLLLALAAVMIVCAVAAAGGLTHRMVSVINGIDLKEPLRDVAFEELSPLLARMDDQNRQIREQMKDLVEQERKFRTITSNMNEGLILLNKKDEISFMNASVRRILGIERMDYAGKNLALFHRSRQMSDVIAAAQKGQTAEAGITFYERKLTVYGNPVVENGSVEGVVLFLVDISEKEQAEQVRREFTANVSHELKTPLTSISGYAELMQSGLARPEDVPVFAGKICAEAGRLLTLINDIIKLSRMDEGQSVQPKEVLDLKDVADEVYERLLPVAEQKNVELQAESVSFQILAVRSMIYDMMYNLCENAIKYNREGGQVLLELLSEEKEGEESRPVVRVTDTGIGIPPEHQERVFERFYRVDKSHSRRTGGTGLGLSIVKHAVEYHGGYIEIHSREGVGTVITVHL